MLDAYRRNLAALRVRYLQDPWILREDLIILARAHTMTVPVHMQTAGCWKSSTSELVPRPHCRVVQAKDKPEGLLQRGWGLLKDLECVASIAMSRAEKLAARLSILSMTYGLRIDEVACIRAR